MKSNGMTARSVGTNGRNSYLQILDDAWQLHIAPRAKDAPTFISTFAGGGGSSLGYSMAGYRELLAVEWDNNAVETFALNFPDVPVYHGDIKKLSVDECMRLAGVGVGELDLLDGSPPCQGFSTAGKRNLDDDRNQFFREFVRLLRGLRPKVFVMEQVSGLVKGKMKLVFAEIMREFKVSGYQVSTRLMNTMYFNVPQSRQRLIFIGVRDDLGAVPSHPEAEKVPVLVGEAFLNVGSSMPAPIKNGQEEVLRHIPQNGSAINYVPQSVLAVHVPKMVNNKTYSFGGICRRLDMRRPSITLSKEFIPYSNTPIHPLEDRWVSGEECKRIASYPDEFVFVGEYKQWLARIGNSVPPLFMRSIARHIRTEILARVSQPERIDAV